jgi:hypothetical protein
VGTDVLAYKNEKKHERSRLSSIIKVISGQDLRPRYALLLPVNVSHFLEK